MRRRLWSLLVLLLLALATQATADDGDDEREGDGDPKDRERHRDREDRKDDEGGDDDGGDDEDDDRDQDDTVKEDDDTERGDRKVNRARDRGQGTEERDEAQDASSPAPMDAAADAKRPGPVAPLPADAGVELLQTVFPGRIMFTFLVSAAGPLDQAQLSASLPEAAAWTVSGPGVSGCTLAGAELICTFRDLSSGDVQLVQATALLREAPAWELVAHATVAAVGDSVPGNDAASAAVGLLLA